MTISVLPEPSTKKGRAPMARRRMSFPATLALFFALLAPLAIVLGLMPAPSPAQAATVWPKPLHNIRPEGVLTHGDGSVSLIGDCSSRDEAYTLSLQTVTPEGGTGTIAPERTYSADSPWKAYPCFGRVAAGRDGTVFTSTWGDFDKVPGYVTVGMAAFRANQLLWQKEVTNCGGITMEPGWMTIGHDGDGYLIMRSRCQEEPDLLVGLAAETGAVKFKQPLETDFSQHYLVLGWDVPVIGTYPGGLVVRDGLQTLRYFDYFGKEDVDARYALPILSDEEVVRFAFHGNGGVTAFVMSAFGYSGPPECSSRNKLRRLLFHAPDGTSRSIPMSPHCTGVGRVMAMPDGGVAFHGDSPTSSYQRLLVLDKAGTKVLDRNITALSGYGTDHAEFAWPQADGNGNIILTRSAIELGSEGDRHVFVDKIRVNPAAPEGSVERLFSTEQFDETGVREDFRYTTTMQVGLYKDAVFVPICREACSSENPPLLHKIAAPGVTMDYPRGAALMPRQTIYAALGDSFSSGEGVPPFTLDTDTNVPPGDPSYNECHRSLSSYPELVAKEAGLRLNLKSVACSGAIATDIWRTSQNYGNTPPQLQQLADMGIEADKRQPGIVSLSIGGNDLGFSLIARACNSGGLEEGKSPRYKRCKDARDQARMLLEENTLLLRIQRSLREIRNAAGPDARIYVVGYAHIFPEWNPSKPLCYWARGERITPEELGDLRALTEELNQEIADAASIIPGVQYLDTVEALKGHESCGNNDPWMHGVVWPLNLEFTYHPNDKGQQAYARVLKAALLKDLPRS